MKRVRAFAVHIFTACGAALALLALIFATGEHWAAMFFCLGLALVVDGVDGPLAREFKVAEVLPRWSGETLDLIVDFTTYVFVPAYAIAASGLLPNALAIPSGVLVVITGALYFADREMKTPDNYFRGFPAVWNLAAFYLYLLEPPPLACRRHDCRAGRADLRADQVSASAARQALARCSTSRCWRRGPCWRSWR